MAMQYRAKADNKKHHHDALLFHKYERHGLRVTAKDRITHGCGVRARCLRSMSLDIICETEVHHDGAFYKSGPVTDIRVKNIK